ncbi:hypothetical protein L0Y65_07095 [Candidatus Micrarchaeota archaeon]|nr:hypothetical protein [Candidatus Micrarchaeota archaeon]
MAKARVLRRQEKAYIELPPDISGEAELEIFQLKEGYYLISVPLGQQAGRTERAEGRQQEHGVLGEGERAVLKKLLSIRFENRTPAHVGGALSGSEMATLGELVQRGLVNVFRGNKYKDGVYNISDSTYALIYPKGDAQAAVAPAQKEADTGGSRRAASATGTLGILHSRGFIIVQDKREAMTLSEQLGGQMKSGEVVGVKGFDGKFYIVTRNFFTKAQAEINAVLKDEMDAPSIASATKLDAEGCLAVLRLMAENGDLVEKKRGVFAPV